MGLVILAVNLSGPAIYAINSWATLSFVDTLVQKFVRYQTPLIYTRRTASRDAGLAVHEIRVGDKTFMW